MNKGDILPHPLHPLQIPEWKGAAVSPGIQYRPFRKCTQGIARIVIGDVVYMLIVFHIVECAYGHGEGQETEPGGRLHWQGAEFSRRKPVKTRLQQSKDAKPDKHRGKEDREE